MAKRGRSKEGQPEMPTVRDGNSMPLSRSDSSEITCRQCGTTQPEPDTSQLQNSEEAALLKTIWNLTPDLLAVKTVRGVYQTINPAFCECFGFDEQEVIGRTDADLFPGKDGEVFLRTDLDTIRQGEPTSTEEIRRTIKGLRHYQVIRIPYCDAQGTPLGLLFCLRDITELKQMIAKAEQAFEAVKKHEQALQQLIDCMPAGIMLLDSELRLLAWNRKYLTYFEPSVKWRVGTRIQDVIPLAEESGMMEKLRRALSSGRPVRVNEFKYEGLRKGTTYWRGVAVPMELTLESGSTAALAVMVVDVTREVMAREKYAQAAELARRREEELLDLYEREHSVAVQLQKSFLMHDVPDIRGFEIVRRYQAASDGALVGGDFYDMFRISARKYGIVIGDVSGRGLNSAIYTAMTKHMLRAYALENSSPNLVLARLNDALTSCTPEEVFVTLIYGVLDFDEGTFTYCNGGHETPIYYSHSTCEVCSLDLTGRALALAPGCDYVCRTVSFDPGDVLVLYTDGISDAGKGSNRLGRESLVAIVETCCTRSGEEIANAIMQAAVEYAGGRLTDDAALLVIRRVPRRRTRSR
ncbi:MAG: SpoIIE family protein phosphatase [Armatimonadota bacterium]|nr:SpoIIE family protein phosphatase [Armatimonadota bacterium]